jgi:hypothetical protein
MQFIKATKGGRIFCNIVSVSASGMSRNLKYYSFEIADKEYYNDGYYSNYMLLMKSLGYSESSKKDGSFKICGCGMDMNFNTHYNIIHDLHRLGFIDKSECENLAQKTPIVL